MTFWVVGGPGSLDASRDGVNQGVDRLAPVLPVSWGRWQPVPAPSLALFAVCCLLGAQASSGAVLSGGVEGGGGDSS